VLSISDQISALAARLLGAAMGFSRIRVVLALMTELELNIVRNTLKNQTGRIGDCKPRPAQVKSFLMPAAFLAVAGDGAGPKSERYTRPGGHGY